MLGQKITPERKLKRVLINLLRNPKVALMSGILTVGRTYLDDKVATARTNGRDEWYGPKFVDGLKEKELAFVKMHEACHKMYRHLTTWRKLYDENPQLANAACDYVINIMLRDLDPQETFMSMPRDPEGNVMGLIDERFRDMNAKQVFDILKQEGGSGGRGKGEPGLDEHDWDDVPEGEEAEELDREIDQAIRQGLIESKKHGNGKDGLARIFEDLSTPKVDWREQLREFVKASCRSKEKSTWRRPNRRLISSGDTYMPSLISERIKHLVPAVDTSGSISTTYLTAFFSEFAGICEQVNPEQVDLLYWGSDVVGHEIYSEATMSNIVSSTKPIGGGGTSPSCIPKYMKDKGLEPECVVVLTDGYVGSDWGGQWDCPVLWCVIGNPEAVAPNGKTIHVEL
jgi:predicted metal-dependent peptidase